MSEKTTSESDWWADFVKRNPIPQESIDYFAATDWTNAILTDPAYHPVPHFSRTLKPSGEDYFFAITVAGAEALRHFILLQKREYKPVAEVQTAQPEVGKSQTSTLTPPAQPDCVFLFSAGKPGLDGHPGVMHGGISCAILDETMGVALLLHIRRVEGPVRLTRIFTAYLNVTYKAPISTPADYAVKAWLTRRQGKKWYVNAQIVDKAGKVYSEGEGLWIQVPAERM